MPISEEPIVALFIGDSYSAGAGATSRANRWTSVVSGGLGWREVNAALGGTGYVATSGPQGCGLDYCGTYAEAIAGVSNLTPDIVVISGGRNDGERLIESPGAVEDTIGAAKERWPDALVVVSSPLWDDDPAPETLDASIEVTRAASLSTAAIYLDLGQPLFEHPEFVGDDGVHPNDAGYEAIAAAFQSAWMAAQVE